MANPIKTWTEYRISRLKEIVKAHSAKEVSEILTKEFRTTITRNAIVGICSREGIQIRNGRKCEHIKVIPKKLREKKVNVQHSKPLPQQKHIEHNPVPFPPEPGRCLAIIGEARGLICCGLPKDDDVSWCPKHRAIYMVPNPRRVLR